LFFCFLLPSSSMPFVENEWAIKLTAISTFCFCPPFLSRRLVSSQHRVRHLFLTFHNSSSGTVFVSWFFQGVTSSGCA
jgi:hypothetical protein